MVPPSSRSLAVARLARGARWLGPSVAAGCAGGLVVGGMAAVAVRAATPHVALIAAGVMVAVAAPVLVLASLVTRGLVRAWQPARLAEVLREDGGAMPRLASGLAVLGLGLVGLAWLMFQGTWLLSSATAFKPLVVGYAQPVIAVAGALGLIAVGAPLARGFAAVLRRLDARWQRRGRRTLLRPRVIASMAVVLGAAILTGVWRAFVQRRLGPLPLAPVMSVLLPLAIVLVTHAAWARLPRARVAGGVVLALGVVVVMVAGHRAARAWPVAALAVGDAGVIGVAAARVLDLDALRDAVPTRALRPPAREGAAHPDIVLVTITSVRADHTPPHGGAADMPVLAELARSGAVFKAAFAPTTSTWPSLAAVALGRGVDRIAQAGAPTRLAPAHVTLAERLQAAGYHTAAFTCCPELWSAAAATGLHRGLDHQASDGEDATLALDVAHWLAERPAGVDARPLFAWVHLGGPARWQDGPAPRDDAERTRRYDAALAQADRALGRVLTTLASRPRPAIVIVAGLHGEALGEHGQVGHGADLYESQLRVPLVITGPGIPAHAIAEPVSLTALAATLLDLAGQVPPGAAGPAGAVPVEPAYAGLALTVEGPSLAPLATRSRLSVPDGGGAIAILPKDRDHPTGLTALVRGRWKLLRAGATVELYDLIQDPAERGNVAGGRSDIVAPMRRVLDDRAAALRQRSERVR